MIHGCGLYYVAKDSKKSDVLERSKTVPTYKCRCSLLTASMSYLNHCSLWVETIILICLFSNTYSETMSWAYNMKFGGSSRAPKFHIICSRHWESCKFRIWFTYALLCYVQYHVIFDIVITKNSYIVVLYDHGIMNVAVNFVWNW